MTIGSRSTKSYGYESYKTWSGSDRAKVSQPLSPVRLKRIERSGVTYFVRDARIGTSRPPKRARNEDHPYTMESLYYKESPTTYRYNTCTDYFTGLFFNYGAGFIYPRHSDGSDVSLGLLDVNDQLKALGRLAENIRGSDFNASVFLAEGHQTLRMIADSATRIRKSLVALRRGDFASSARFLVDGTPRSRHRVPRGFSRSRTEAAMSSNWLQLQYGWLPLLSDMDSGARGLAHQLSVPFRTSYAATAKKEKTSTVTWGAPTPCDSTFQYGWTTTHRARYAVRISEAPSLAWSLGLLDPLSVAWEKLPWSFVIDWALPIGQYLEARSISSLQVAKYVVSEKRTVRFNGISGNANCDLVYRRVWFNRYVADTLDVPLPTFKPLAKVASWQHCANALALLSQVKRF